MTRGWLRVKQWLGLGGGAGGSRPGAPETRLAPEPAPGGAAAPRAPAAPVLVTRVRPESGDLYLVFHGHGNQLFLEPAYFLSVTGLLDRNLVLLRDPRRAYFLLGLKGRFEGFEALKGGLAALRAELGHVRRLFCAGTSAGGYGALLYGHHLGAEEVIAFGPPSFIDAERVARRPMRAGVRDCPADHLDLARLLARGDGRTRYRIYYSAGCEQDVRQAEHLAGCPGVTLLPRPGRDHNVLEAMKSSGELANLFPASAAPLAPGAPRAESMP